MPSAARLGDPIGHSPSMSWLLRGLLIGIGIGVAAALVIGTGGLAAAALAGGAAAAGAGLGELMSMMSWAPKEVVGQIQSGSGNVFINGRKAARAHVDITQCGKHPKSPQLLATGSGNVYINGMPVARVGDKTVCGAVVTAGSGNVYIGGGTQQTDVIHPEKLVPGWVHVLLFAVGTASAVGLAGPIVAGIGLAGGLAGDMLGGWTGGKLFGEGSDGQKWSRLAGSLVGGWFGAKGGQGLANKAVPVPITNWQGFIKGGLPGVKKTPTVTAEGKIGDAVFTDVNQTARPATQADANQPTLISKRVTDKIEKTGKSLPNGNMADAHAEIGVIQQAFNARKTQGSNMFMNVTGKDVCGYCKGDIAAAANEAGLKSLTIQATDDITGLPKTYYWSPGMKSIKEKP